QVLLRAQSGKPASFFVGDRYPITLSLLSGSTGNTAALTGLPGSTVFPQTSFTVGANPSALVANNFTGGTLPDLAVVFDDPKANTNELFTEEPGSPFAVGNNPRSVVVADFNGDGLLDFAIANQGDNSISLFRGQGDGTFVEFPGSPFKLTNTSTISQAAPVAMVSGNFRNRTNTVNNAAEQDLAVVNQGSNNISILLSSVDQNLNVTLVEAAGSPISVGTTPVAIAKGDLNADGVLDLAVVNQGSATVSILLGSSNLDGTFSEATGSP